MTEREITEWDCFDYPSNCAKQIKTLKKLLAECQEAENERRYDALMDDGRDFTPPYEP
jgi:hypothetical protein